MYKQNTLEVRVTDTVIEQNEQGEPVIYVKNADSDMPLYKVSIFLEGNDLPFVDSVEYELHKTFRDRYKRINRTPGNPNCKLVIWTWGIFEIRATVNTKDGSAFDIYHSLRYGDDIEHGKYQLVRQ